MLRWTLKVVQSPRERMFLQANTRMVVSQLASESFGKAEAIAKRVAPAASMSTEAALIKLKTAIKIRLFLMLIDEKLKRNH